MANWNSSDDDEEDESNFTDEDVKNWIKNGREAESSNLFCGIYGDDGTGKTGIAMDSISQEELDDGEQMFIIDLDDSASSIKKKYHNNHKNIVIFEPMKEVSDGARNAPEIYNAIDKFTDYLLNNEDELNLHSVILDGVDEFKDICGDKMQIEDLNKDPNARVKNSWNWQIRNRYYKDILEKIKKLNCHRFLITHMKEKREPVNGELQVVGEEINWHHSTNPMLFQKVYTQTEEVEEGLTEFKATIEKSKGALGLRGKTYTVATVNQEDETENWEGLNEFFDEVK